MVQATGSRRAKVRKRTSAEPDGELESQAPPALARTSVCRRVPISVRARLDQAILLRPADCPSLESIADKFALTERYGIKGPALRTYARRLEQCVRPALTSQLMAALLGCLPENYRRQLVNGTQVLLLSRVIQALSTRQSEALPVADLAKLASVLSAVAGRTTTSRGRAGKATGRPDRNKSEQDSASPPTEPARIAEAVRMVYGLPWPPADDSSSAKGG